MRVARIAAAPMGRRGLLTAATGLALTACGADLNLESSTPSASATSTGLRFVGDPGPDRAYLGVSLATSEAAIERPELGGQRLSMVRRFYRHWQSQLLHQMAAQDLAADILPFVSIKTPGLWSSVASGADDRWTVRLLEGLADLDAPVWLAVHHEPENDQGSHGIASEWRDMQAYVARRAAQICPKVTVVPVLMAWTFSAESGRDPYEWLVDTPVQGVDVYNQWEPGSVKPFLDFADLMVDVRRFVPDLPVVVPECGSVIDPEDHTSAGRWLLNAFEAAIEGDVVGLAWFNSEHNNRDGGLQLDAYAEGVLRTLVERRGVARLSEPGSTSRRSS